MTIKPRQTDEWKSKVLKSIVLFRNNKARICRSAGIHRDTLYEWLNRDSSFKVEYERQVEVLEKLKLLEQYRKAKLLLENGKAVEALLLINSSSPEVEEELAHFQKLKKQVNLKHGRRY